AEVVSPVQNKVGAYLANRPLRNILGQVKSSFDVQRLMDQGGILIVNLAKGRLGEDAANLLGSFLVTKLQLAAMARAGMPETERRDFYLYVDEFHNFTTQSFADILSEARKYRLNLTLANQYLGQMADSVRQAVLANVGTLVIFRVGPEDAESLGKEFGATWPRSNLVNLNPHEIWYKLMHDGRVVGPHAASTLAPPYPPGRDGDEYREALQALSRQRHGRPREAVEQKIARFFGGNGNG
ncbi:MAG TPA: type IV secretory system conjugative DNA transfer family protein, partial [Anaerolineales bacterium]